MRSRGELQITSMVIWRHWDDDTYGYGSIPINTIFSGMNIHKSQLFWCELQGYKVLTHCHIIEIWNSLSLSLSVDTCTHANTHTACLRRMFEIAIIRHHLERISLEKKPLFPAVFVMTREVDYLGRVPKTGAVPGATSGAKTKVDGRNWNVTLVLYLGEKVVEQWNLVEQSGIFTIAGIFWLVASNASNINFIFHFIQGIILPIDELRFFKMVKTTNQFCLEYFGETCRLPGRGAYTPGRAIHSSWHCRNRAGNDAASRGRRGAGGHHDVGEAWKERVFFGGMGVGPKKLGENRQDTTVDTVVISVVFLFEWTLARNVRKSLTMCCFSNQFCYLECGQIGAWPAKTFIFTCRTRDLNGFESARIGQNIGDICQQSYCRSKFSILGQLKQQNNWPVKQQ